MMARERYRALMAQPQVRTFLEHAVETGQVSHAYLFVGPPGSGKTETGLEFAAAILCEQGGCGECDSCIRVAHRTHPDVRILSPEGASGYVIEQVRELNRDVFLAPIRATRKVYLIQRADLLTGAAANAFLKTLEEPPDDVVFILLGRVQSNIMETILSRCQVVLFRRIPEQGACRYLERSTGATAEQARIALASAAGSLTRARDFLVLPSLKALRARTIEVLSRLPDADDLDVLEAADELLAAVRSPLEGIKERQKRELDEGRDYFSRGVMKQLETRQKRELSSAERDNLQDMSRIMGTWLEDCLMLLQGRAGSVVNTDVRMQLESVSARAELAGIAKAYAALETARGRISYNVTPQLVIEAMLFDMRKAFQ
jgi:DNA polymerase-3 subunit delta'